MPNNPARNRVGHNPPPSTSANKIVRGGVLAEQIETRSVPTDKQGGSGGTTPPTSSGGVGVPLTGGLGRILRKKISGTITTTADEEWVPTSWFDVRQWGAACDGSTDDTATLNAVLVLAANAHGTMFIPGFCAISDQVALPAGFTGSVAIRGAGRRNSGLIQTVSGKNGIYCDLSTGGARWNNTVEITDLAVYCSVATGLQAITVTYGTTNIGSVANNSGSAVQRCEVNNTVFTNNGTGWTAGVWMVNAWNHKITDCFCVLQQTGAGTVGTGACFRASSGINYQWTMLSAAIAAEAFTIDSIGAGQGAQGVLMSQMFTLSVGKSLTVTGTAVEGIFLSVFEFDQRTSTHGISCTAVQDFVAHAGEVIINTGTGMIFAGCGSVFVSDCSINGATATEIGIDVQAGTNGVHLRDNQFSGCAANLDIQIAAAAGFVDCNSGQVTDIGSTGSVIGRARQISVVRTLTGGAPSETISVDISSCLFPGQATAAQISIASGLPNLIVGAYDFGNGGNSRTNAVFVIYMSDGSNVPAATVRFSCLFNP